MSARDQLHRLVEELDEEQAERALAVLESAADWVLTAELTVARKRPTVARQRHGVPGESGGAERPAEVATVDNAALDTTAYPQAVGAAVRKVAVGQVTSGGRHRGR